MSDNTDLSLAEMRKMVDVMSDTKPPFGIDDATKAVDLQMAQATERAQDSIDTLLTKQMRAEMKKRDEEAAFGRAVREAFGPEVTVKNLLGLYEILDLISYCGYMSKDCAQIASRALSRLAPKVVEDSDAHP